MNYQLKAPARINLLGNPTDANEGDFATISAAVNIYAHAVIEPILDSQKIVLEQVDMDRNQSIRTIHEEHSTTAIPLPLFGKFKLIKAAINRLFYFSAEFQEKVRKNGFFLKTWTDVPRQSGLGGSSLFVILTLGGLRALYELDPFHHNNYTFAEITQRVEAKDLNITAGYADRYVPFFGGIAYIDYRGKLHQKSLQEEPYATYERLDPWGESLPIVAISSGIEHDSGDVHFKMRPKYLQEYDDWLSQGGESPPMVRFMQTAWETAWRGKIALLDRDWQTFGDLMNTNHAVVDQMMRYCGFKDGAGWVNNLLIQTALDHGAYGAKLTGAGHGGSVFAITHPENKNDLKEIWERKAAESGLRKSTIYIPRITQNGLCVSPL